jgi:uncharacterized protein
VIGIIILIAGILIAAAGARTFAYKQWKLVVLSIVASFNKSMSGGGYGPIVTSGQVLSGVEARAAVGITSFAEAFTCLVGVAFFLSKGQMVDPQLAIPASCGAMLSVPFAAPIVNSVSEARFKHVIGTITIVMALVILVKTLF